MDLEYEETTTLHEQRLQQHHHQQERWAVTEDNHGSGDDEDGGANQLGINEQQHGRIQHRRRSSTATTTSTVSSVVGNGHMTEAEQEERRRQIKRIMCDTTLSQKEKSKSIQALMDGRAVVSAATAATRSASMGHYSTNSTSSGQEQQHNPTMTSYRRGSASSYASSNASTDYACSMANVAAMAADYYSNAANNNNSSTSDDFSITEHDPLDHGNGNGNGGGVPIAIADFQFLNLQSNNNNNNNTTSSYASYHLPSPSSNTGYYRPTDEQSVASTVSSYGGGGGNGHHHHHQQSPALQQSPQQQQLMPPRGSSYRQYHGRSRSLQDWNDTDRITAAANTTVFCNPHQVSRLMEQSRPVCEHYERNCTIISPCCGLAFGCRICHDDCPILPPPLQSYRRLSATHAVAAAPATTTTTPTTTPGHKNKVERRRSMPLELNGHDDEDDHHLIDRFSIREVICRQCYTRQSSKTNNCIMCGVQFGLYHCNICNLWMSDKEQPYHCADCGFCRVGGRENFTHCHDCGMCIDAFLAEDHNCKSGKYMSDCPICQEDLFSSRFASHEMPCGHAIHWHCFKELTSYDTRCPVCKKTAESPDQMAATWSTIAMGIALQPVPPEMARMVNIFCNDCESSDCNLRWHFLGVRCRQCFSFNTSVEQIVMQGRDAAIYLDRLEASYSITGAAAAAHGGIPSDISMPANIIFTGPSSSSSVPAYHESSDRMDEDMPSGRETSEGSSDLTR